MPRTARQDLTSRFLHVLNRGNDRATVFHKDGDYAAFLRCFAAAKARYGDSPSCPEGLSPSSQRQAQPPIKTFCFCLMPNHFHMVIESDGPETLATFMQRWMTRHVRRYHAHYRTSGHLWQGRFKSFPVTDEAHFLTVFRYVLQNPVRAGLAARARRWRWSSLNFPDLTDPSPVELPPDLDGWLDEPLAHAELNHLRALINRPALLRRTLGPSVSTSSPANRRPGQTP